MQYLRFVDVLGAIDLGNSGEEVFLQAVESDEMKSSTTPLATVAIMPSPVLLWRLKVSIVWKICSNGYKNVGVTYDLT